MNADLFAMMKPALSEREFEVYVGLAICIY
jgi:hypothetical protein